MAYIGMRYPVAAKVNSHTEGSTISYDTGFVIGTAVSATVNLTRNESKDYGDDVVQDVDNGITGYNITLETNDLPVASLEKLLGWEPDSTTSPAEYYITDKPGPEVGFGYIRVKRVAGTLKYETFWFYKTRFQMESINSATKEENITWNHPSISAEGIGANLDSSGHPKFAAYMLHETYTAAETWLKSKAGIT